MKLTRDFYVQPTEFVARELLGKYLVRVHADGITVGRIIETEAYIGLEDKASHASRGPTPRAAIMFGPPGFAYIYLIYGMHHCLNVVTEAEDYPAAVLLRAVEPIAGIELMQRRRPTTKIHLLTNGPGKICQSFAIDRRLNAADMCGDVLFIEDHGEPPGDIVASTRVGVDFAGPWRDKLWRFYVRDHLSVSKR